MPAYILRAQQGPKRQKHGNLGQNFGQQKFDDTILADPVDQFGGLGLQLGKHFFILTLGLGLGMG